MGNKLYKQLAIQIGNDYASAGTLPGERILAVRYACTRSTIRAALREMYGLGHLESSPGRKHQLLKGATAVGHAGRRTWNIVMFTERHKLEDQNFLDFVAGVIHQAKLSSVNLVIREIDSGIGADSAAALVQFHDGIEADAYLLAGCVSERLRGFLENLLKPCVVLGEALFLPPAKRRFFQVCLPMGETYRFIFSMLLSLGHRKFLTVASPSSRLDEFARQCFREHGVADATIDLVTIESQMNPTVPCHGVARKVREAIGGHTALFVPFGGATALAIYKELLDAGVEMPRKLSLVVNSGRFDFFANVFGISSVFSSAWEEGAACVEELARQLRLSDLRFGCKMSHYLYVEGHTVGPPFTDEGGRKRRNQL
jgi:DNA-binding LacI/PurR family transcriptional regulator